MQKHPKDNELDPPDAVFIGGGLNEELLLQVLGRIRGGTRLVINAVTWKAKHPYRKTARHGWSIDTL